MGDCSGSNDETLKHPIASLYDMGVSGPNISNTIIIPRKETRTFFHLLINWHYYPLRFV
jgi:hypothetical protein